MDLPQVTMTRFLMEKVTTLSILSVGERLRLVKHRSRGRSRVRAPAGSTLRILK